MTGSGTTYADQVRAWAASLRSGSTQTWTDFREGGFETVAAQPPQPPDQTAAQPPQPPDETAAQPPQPPDQTAGDESPLPGAGQLELVRRLARRSPGLTDFAGLADLVLATAGPGRGRLDPPLPWSDQPEFGSPAVAPEQLSPDELLRACAGTITRLLPLLPGTPAPRGPRWRPFQKQFVLLGAPSTARIIRGALEARGLRSGGAKPTYVVLAGPLDDVMAQRWSARVTAGSTIRWRRFWRYARAHDRVPPAIQAPDIAARLAGQFGPTRVHVVVARSTAESMRQVARILGIDPPEVPEPTELQATDLLRVVNAPLTLAVGGAERERIVREVWPRLLGQQPQQRIGVPLKHVEWATAAAQRQAQRLAEGARSAGYAVHGDPAILVPDLAAPVNRAIRRESTLALGLDVLARAWVEAQQAPEGGD